MNESFESEDICNYSESINQKEEEKEELNEKKTKSEITSSNNNLNEIESNIPYGRKWSKNTDKKKEINIGFQLDSRYVLRAMMTIASIMDSQKPKMIIRLHFAVVLNFIIKM